MHAMLLAVQADQGIAAAVAPPLRDVAARRGIDFGLRREAPLEGAPGVLFADAAGL
jgi:hypothetical protein